MQSQKYLRANFMVSYENINITKWNKFIKEVHQRSWSVEPLPQSRGELVGEHIQLSEKCMKVSLYKQLSLLAWFFFTRANVSYKFYGKFAFNFH